MSVIATIASNIAMSTYWPSPVRSRWRSAARIPITPNRRRADVAERADRDGHRRLARMPVVVDARHRLDDRRVRRPVAVGRVDRVAEAGDRHVDRARMARGDVGVAEAHPVHRAGLEVLGDDVELRARAPGTARGPPATSGRARRCACRSCCAGRSRRPCGPADRASPATRPRPDSPCSGCSTFTTSAPSRASICVANGQRLHLLGRQHAHAVERLAEALRACVRHVSQLHGDTVRRGSRPALRWASARRRPRRLPAMRGIISAAGYVPFRRLDRGDIAKTFGSGGGKGTRSVASYDEDTTTMGVEAARLARRSAPEGTALGALWFSTANPAYLDKNNASAIHAALRLDTAGGRARLRRRAALGRRRAAHRARRQRLRDGDRLRHARRPPDERRRVAGRRRRRRGARRLRRRRSGHRRVPRRRERDRGVHRAVARAGLAIGHAPGKSASAR